METTQLALSLVDDSSSHLAAAVRGWEYAASREQVALADVYDAIQYLAAVTVATATGGAEILEIIPYPRPYQTTTETDKPMMLPDDIAAILDTLSPVKEAADG